MKPGNISDVLTCFHVRLVVSAGMLLLSARDVHFLSIEPINYLSTTPTTTSHHVEQYDARSAYEGYAGE
jgi:hypothetical protein